MNFLRKFAFLLLPITVSISYANPLSITESEINHYLATRLHEKVPLQDSLGIPHLFQLDYKLHNLATKIGQTDEKRVEVLGVIEGLLKLKGKKYNVTLNLNLDTLPYYDTEKGALFLRDTHLKNWAITPEKYQSELQPFVSLLASGLADILGNYPIYTLDENKAQEALVKKFGKQIVVEKGVIKLETSIW